MYMYICIYIYIHICTYICIHMFTCIYVYMYTIYTHLVCSVRHRKAPCQITAIAVQSLSEILSSAGKKFVFPPSSMLASCLPDALLFSGEEDASLSVWNLCSTKLNGTTVVIHRNVLPRDVYL